jgi:hypothetical protein
MIVTGMMVPGEKKWLYCYAESRREKKTSKLGISILTGTTVRDCKKLLDRRGC